jgi:hypothetical protein
LRLHSRYQEFSVLLGYSLAFPFESGAASYTTSLAPYAYLHLLTASSCLLAISFSRIFCGVWPWVSHKSGQRVPCRLLGIHGRSLCPPLLKPAPAEFDSNLSLSCQF